ncbi:MAG: hypothetical protein II350_04455, partial [Clostridia bacterium]|nr:hypothetical protein [Clostridia bacterium]
PLSALVAIIAFVVGCKDWWLTAAAAAFSLCVQLFINVALRLFSRNGVQRKHSDVYSGWRGGVMLAFSRFVFLPFEAWVTLRSSLTALWRMTVSKKRLLEWVTAAEGDRLSPKGPLKTYCSMISCVVIAAITILLGMDTGSFALAVIWLLAPLYGAYLSVAIEKTKKISVADKRLLTDHAEKIESYFSDLFKTSYLLPCDNYQELPYVGWADRTSPTNIGMCFLAAVASAELGLISRDDAVFRCEKLCTAVEGLEKYKGNLYNWYSCSQAKPLEPRFISSVDSGNLVAALATAASEFSLWDSDRAVSLSKRLESLWRDTDLSVFYNDKQKLMCIGLDGEKKRLGGFYDMLAGEARLTYYVAAAKGDIPAQSWSSLSRASVKAWGYAGLASWSGSLFEYLMPEIFMPVYENSLLYEGGEFAIGTQKRFGDSLGLPWGVSECCYPEFDPMMNYQYKAHGNSRLALGNVGTGEYIVSPYSSYLALGRGVKRVCRNLERITEYGAMGRYGLCESLDFTGSRVPDGMDSVSVKTYMTHHLGMSLCSIANALCDSVFIKRFMSVPEFSAMEQFLKEQLTTNNHFRAARTERVIKDKRENANLSFKNMVCKQWDNGNIPCGIVSDGGLAVWGNANGDIISRKNGIPLYRSDIGFKVTVAIGEDSYFLKGEGSKADIKRCFTVNKDSFEYAFEHKGIKITERICAVKGLSTEKHVITVCSEVPENIRLSVYFEPQLCSEEKYKAHPEFERLKLEAKSEDKRNILVKRRDSSNGDRFMWISTDCLPENLCLSRSGAIGRGGCDSANIFFENIKDELKSDGDTCVELSYAFKTEAKKEIIFEISLSAASECDVAKRCALEALQSLRRSSDFYGLCIKEKLDQQGIWECLNMSGVIARWDFCFTGVKRIGGKKSDLWKLKISGDNPLAVVSSADFTSEGDFLSKVFRLFKCHKILSAIGFRFDLAILCNDGGNYDRPVFNGIGVAIRLAGVADALNADGGIHVIDKGSAENDSIGALYSFGMFFPCKTEKEKIPFHSESPSRHAEGSLPKRIHSLPLANKCFGAVMADIGPILIYFKNSRLLKLMPWQNDPLASSCRGMKLCIDYGGKKYSLFCENDGIPSKVEFSPGKIVWKRNFAETEYIVTAFTDPVLPSLTFDIKARGEDISDLYWEMSPCLCEHEKDSVFLRCGGDENIFTAENPTDQTGTSFYAVWSSFPEIRAKDCWAGKFGFVRNEFGRSLSLCLSVCEGVANVGANFASEKEESAKNSFNFENVIIHTDNSRLDGYINTWSEYQIKVSRLWAKSSAFQNGGAVGFRDQLQDAASLLLTSPEILREQILKCCAHQYEEGDVMHWFHEGAESFRCGVRTRCSDDLLWLPREVGEYVLTTGDGSILEVSVSYLKSEPLKNSENDRYETVVFSNLKESVFDHCVRAIGKFISRGTDDKGLPRILGGDWNDGFSKLGEKGEGVSIWLAFFAAESLSLFSRICEISSREDLAAKFREYAKTLVDAAKNSWDGDRFIRAITDSGLVLGAKNSSVFEIDSIAQSFSWFVESTDKEFSDKREIALNTALRLLWDKNRGVCKLFDRPVTDRSLGYISDYPSGVRENGGQYTHAAIWLAIACFKAGRADDGYGILKDIIDVGYTENYEGESFVIAADVSDKGRCGWSWYTGSAGWFRRAVLEYMLGIRLEMGVLRVSPNLPSCMDGYVCNIKIKGTLCKIRVRRTGIRKEFYGDIGSQDEFEIEVTV